jgi:lipopolysaccharide transport system permease protein
VSVSSGSEALAHEGCVPEAPPAPPDGADVPVTVLERRPGWRLLDLGALWRYRELLFFLTWRDVKVRYKQTTLGVAWAVLQPLATMVVMSLFFGRLADMPSENVPYPLFVFTGLVPWTFFAGAITAAGQSIVGNQNLVTKVYFPRLIIPMGAVGAGLVDLLIASGMLLVLVVYYFLTASGPLPGWGLLLLPLTVLGLVTAALGVGALLAALTVAYRDFRHVVPFLVQLWMFATPSVYMQADGVLHPRWQAVLPLNPAHGLIAAFRAAALGREFDLYGLAVSATASVVLLLAGCFYFRGVERGFADVV